METISIYDTRHWGWCKGTGFFGGGGVKNVMFERAAATFKPGRNGHNSTLLHMQNVSTE